MIISYVLLIGFYISLGVGFHKLENKINRQIGGNGSGWYWNVLFWPLGLLVFALFADILVNNNEYVSSEYNSHQVNIVTIPRIKK